MKAISLWQPWASAIHVGLKSIETRSWPAPKSMIGQRIAIHAAKRDELVQRAWWIERVRPNGEYSAAFGRHGFYEWDDLPFGMIAATAILAGVVSTNDDPDKAGQYAHRGGIPCPLNTDEAWGDFSPDRYAWFLRDIVPLNPPVPVVGRQGFFTVELP